MVGFVRFVISVVKKYLIETFFIDLRDRVKWNGFYCGLFSETLSDDGERAEKYLPQEAQNAQKLTGFDLCSLWIRWLVFLWIL